MKIEKKCHPEFFEQILNGNKTFELRLADWKCNVGDTLILKEWDPKSKEYTGRIVEKQIKYILKTKDIKYWSKEDIEKYGYQILALR